MFLSRWSTISRCSPTSHPCVCSADLVHYLGTAPTDRRLLPHQYHRRKRLPVARVLMLRQCADRSAVSRLGVIDASSFSARLLLQLLLLLPPRQTNALDRGIGLRHAASAASAAATAASTTSSLLLLLLHTRACVTPEASDCTAPSFISPFPTPATPPRLRGN